MFTITLVENDEDKAKRFSKSAIFMAVKDASLFFVYYIFIVCTVTFMPKHPSHSTVDECMDGRMGKGFFLPKFLENYLI